MNHKLKEFIKRSKVRGFTLVELMVVVSITGILAAIAVPNFQIQQARSRQYEVRTNLSSLYSAESTTAVETQSFSACLADIGYVPSTSYYAVGFTSSGIGTCGPAASGCVTTGYTGGCNSAAQIGMALCYEPGQTCNYPTWNGFWICTTQTTCAHPASSCLNTFAGGNTTPCSQGATATSAMIAATQGAGGTPVTSLGTNSSISTSSFVAEGDGKISGQVSGNDVWTIDSGKNLLLVTQGF